MMEDVTQPTHQPDGSPAEGLPAGLLAAFWRYDQALLANDQDTLNELFMPGDETLRGDGRGVLVGHAAIVGFRSGRAVLPTRAVERLHAQVIDADTAVLMARTRDGAATGLQTQMWRRIDGRWMVAAAHVSLPAAPPAFDRSVWRVVGDPLVPAATSAGPLAGLGLAVKDLIAVAGQPIGGGVPAWLAEQRPQPAHAPALAALLAAGAHVLGIARTDEFAYSLAGANPHYGTPPNQAHPDGVSGGSSSGPASAVALGQAEIGLGTDTAGSLRVPASYQNLVGLRPTHGAVSAVDVLPLAPSFDTVGWLTRDLRTCQLVADVLLPRGGVAPARTLRIAELEGLARPDIAELFASDVDGLVAAGALPPVVWAELDRDPLERWFTAFRTVQAFEAWQARGAWVTDHPGALGPDVAARFALAAEITDTEHAQARDVAAEARATVRAWLADAVLVLPSAATPAPSRTATPDEIETARASTLRLTCVAGLAGAPGLSLPRLHSAEGHPVGFGLVAAPGADHQLLNLAARLSAVEEA
jgi:Asp-tRNA(Asn)/Glu-tRNA(Gln) amidotransferase A subunit family amidase